MTEPAAPRPISPTGVKIVPKRRRWRSFFLGMMILLFGIAIGAGGTVVIAKRVILHAIHHPEEAPKRMTERVRSKLDLSEEQTAKVKAILTERQKEIQALRRRIQPEVENELQKAKEEVAAILRPDQAEKWRERFDQLRIWFPALPPDGSSSPAKPEEQ
ncbi:MAG: hypothetical protein HY912_23440 [Desulfomonile tiedjei]|uniref:Periplasmic heavy metal sensor n=1 Tax=Desulfomonile tiedjei TaxID=2358 RepID=A0A9D6V7P3_9BACT|nr:hypothetical protein [Desulfomonile tiedjei]